MREEELWTIASAVETKYRESSFGRGLSSSMHLHRLFWDPANEAFVRGDLYGFGTGNSWDWTSYPCSKELAEAILNLCATDEVQRRFLGSTYFEDEDNELYMCGNSVVSLQRHRAHHNKTGPFALAAFSFQFYAPDWTLQRVSLGGHELSQCFAQKINGASPDATRVALNKVRVAA